MSKRCAREWLNVRTRSAQRLAALLILVALSSTGCSPDEPAACTECDTHADAGTPEAGALEAGARDDAAVVADIDATADAWPNVPSDARLGGSSRCGTTEAPVTEAVERAYRLAALREQLERPHTFNAQRRTWNPSDASGMEQPIEVELVIEVGEFSFHESGSTDEDYCDHVRAPLRMQVRSRDANELFGFTARGSLWLEETSLETLVYAPADPASVTGDVFAPGLVEVTLSVFPRQVRGEIHSSGVLLSLVPDACSQHELPLSPDEHVDFLGGRSVAELVAEAEAALGPARTYNAVWQDSAETTLTLELGGGAQADACAQYELPLRDPEDRRYQPHIELRVPYAGRLSTGDGRLALPLNQLVLSVGMEDGTLLHLNGRSDALASDFAEQGVRGFGDRLDAWIDFDLETDPASADGIIEIQDGGPTSWTPVDCIAWPTAGYWDRNQCRYMR